MKKNRVTELNEQQGKGRTKTIDVSNCLIPDWLQNLLPNLTSKLRAKLLNKGRTSTFFGQGLVDYNTIANYPDYFDANLTTEEFVISRLSQNY